MILRYVGKLAGIGRAMKAGIGSASFEVPSGLVVGALAAVNGFGDIIDPDTGHVVARRPKRPIPSGP